MLSVIEQIDDGYLLDYTIVVPAYNEESYLGDVLDVLLLGMSKIPKLKGEIIVVDNNSTDQTAKIAKSRGARVVFESINQISRARNTGAKEALGRYLIFVDADTKIPSELLALSLKKMEQDECGGGGATLKFDSNQNQLFFGTFMPFFWSCISQTFKLAAGSFIFCKTRLFIKVEGFSEKLFAGEELLFSMQIKKVCKTEKLKFQILSSYPVITSSRKLSWFKPSQILLAILIPLFFPWAVRSRRWCSFWYRRPMD